MKPWYSYYEHNLRKFVLFSSFFNHQKGTSCHAKLYSKLKLWVKRFPKMKEIQVAISTFIFRLYHLMYLLRPENFVKNSFNQVFNITQNYTFCLHSETCKSRLYQKCPFIKKSTILIQLLWNFVKIRYTCIPPFSKVSLWLGKNCRFFNKRTFLVESGFVCSRV